MKTEIFLKAQKIEGEIRNVNHVLGRCREALKRDSLVISISDSSGAVLTNAEMYLDKSAKEYLQECIDQLEKRLTSLIKQFNDL